MPALPSPVPVSPAAIRTNNTNKPLMQSLGSGLPSERRAEALAAPASANASMDPVAPGEGFGSSFWSFVGLSVPPQPSPGRLAPPAPAAACSRPATARLFVIQSIYLFILSASPTRKRKKIPSACQLTRV